MDLLTTWQVIYQKMEDSSTEMERWTLHQVKNMLMLFGAHLSGYKLKNFDPKFQEN